MVQTPLSGGSVEAESERRIRRRQLEGRQLGEQRQLAGGVVLVHTTHFEKGV